MIPNILKKRSKSERKLIYAASLVLLCAIIVGVYFIVNAIANKNDKPGEGGGGSYLGASLAYPSIESSAIQSVLISSNGTEMTFGLMRDSLYQNEFVFIYSDEKGNQLVYMPDVAYQDSFFDYKDLYAYTQIASGVTMPKITYITSAIGYLYYNEKIEIDPANKAEQLARYGITSESPVIAFDYKTFNEEGLPIVDQSGKYVTEKHKITIGNKAVTSSSYYFTLDDEPYIYVTATTYFDYALTSFESFLHSTLISAGLDNDTINAALYTPCYKQWDNTVYTFKKDEHGNVTYYYIKDGKEIPCDPWQSASDRELLLVKDGQDVVVKAESITPIDKAAGYVPDDLQPTEGADGFIYADDLNVTFALSSLKNSSDYRFFMNSIKNKLVGMYNGNDSFLATVLLESKPVDFGESTAVTYKYVITAIESVLGDNGESNAAGAAVAGNSAVKVTYDYYIDGTKKNNAPCHAVIDLEAQSTYLPSAVKTQLLAENVGTLATPIEFEINYDSEAQNAITRTTKIVISDIISAYDSSGVNYVSKIDESSIVSFRYYFEIDGVRVSEEDTVTLNLYSIFPGTYYEIFKQALIGQTFLSAEKENITVEEYVEHIQPFVHFMTYEISEITRAISPELIVSFKYIQSALRDPYYRESIYYNTLAEFEEDHPNRVYAINQSSCQTLVAILGGMGQNASSSVGLSGLETVAIGITPDVMEKYGLYANTIYFELPRGFMPSEHGEDYINYYETLNFTLYVSEKQLDGSRYIGSTLYDIVAKVDNKDFDFIESSFVELWARRNLVLVDIADVDKVEIDLNFEDVYGSYDFYLNHVMLYIYNGQAYLDKGDLPAGVSGSPYDSISIKVGADGSMSESEFSKYFADNAITEGGKQIVKFNDFYKDVSGIEFVGSDSSATGNFKEFMLLLYSTYFEGTLTKEEQAAAKADIGTDKPLMTLKVTVEKSSSAPYCFDFYRIDDRRVMVSVYREFTEGVKSNESCDFYISTFTFKKLVGSATGLLDAKTVDSEQPDGVKPEN